jgi:hypothetical protein
MAVLEFYCSVCGSPHSIELKNIPASGIRGPCKECGAMITVYPDGRLKGADTGDAAGQDPVKAEAQAGTRNVPGSEAPDEDLSVEFQCPFCNWLHRIPARRVGPDGLEGHCAQCHKPLKVLPDGSVLQRDAASASPGSTPAKSGEEYKGPWEVNVSGEPMGPFTLEEMKELSRSGKLSESSLVRPPGEARWSSAERFDRLAAIWKSDDESPEPFAGTRDQCHAHPTRLPVRQCTVCGFFLCEDCLETRNAVGMILASPLCGSCGGKTVPLKILRKHPPFYRDLGQVFSAPFQWPAPIYLGFLALLEILKGPARHSVFGLWAVLALTVFQTVFYLEVMRQVATGAYDIPDWPDVNHIPEMIWEYMKVVLVGLVALLPALLVFCLLSSSLVPLIVFGPGRGTPMPSPWLLVLAGVFLLGYLVYLPASIGLAAVFDALVPGLNPLRVIQTIRRMGAAYWIAVGFWTGLLAVRIGAQVLLDLIPVAGLVLSGILTAYLYLLMSYVWGRVLFENEKKITRT